MKRFTAVVLAAALVLGLTACGQGESAGSGAGASGSAAGETAGADGETIEAGEDNAGAAGEGDSAKGSAAADVSGAGENSGESGDSGVSEAGTVSDKAYIEQALNLANNGEQEWTYSEEADAWVLSIVQAVVYPELPDQQGVSVCVPGAYVTGIDTDGDGSGDVTSADKPGAVKGSLVIDSDASIISTNGQEYTAATAPVIINTGAAGYGSSTNTTAATTYAAEGYINVSCGNRGKQDTAVDENGNTYYTGDAPSCLTDQKNAARFVRYNILLGNLPGSVDYFVSTGGSGGGAHAIMFAATSDNPDFYDYQAAAGAVGVYRLEDGSFETTVTIDGEEKEISDGAWGCISYSGITSLQEADMAMAFEYYLDADYEFGSSFQKALAGHLASSYMDYINGRGLKAEESAVGFDLNGDGDLEDTTELTIEYDPEEYPETNGYHGTYLDLYLAEFTENLQWYLDNLDYAEGWTWFGEDGGALSDAEVAAMDSEDRARAFIKGRYTAPSTGKGFGGMGMMGGLGMGLPDGGMTGDGGLPAEDGIPMDGSLPGSESAGIDNSMVAENSRGDSMVVGTPDAGTTQAAGSSIDSANYSDYKEMLEEYEADIAEIEAGDIYGNNLVELYDPLNYIGAEGTNDPVWTRILMGAAEGDMSMFSSLHLQIAMLDAGIDAEIEWQWNGGHVPSEIFSESFALYVDQMYGEHVNGKSAEAAPADPAVTNGDSGEAEGTDISGWVNCEDPGSVSFTLAAAAHYRTDGASKTIPGFDVIDYGQEDYVFGNTERDARHWDKYLLKVLKENEEELSELFNAGS